MEFILDTNICIYIINKKPAIVLARLEKIPIDSIVLSAITVAELQYGVQKSSNVQRNQEALDAFIGPFRIVDFDSAATFEYGQIRSALEAAGTPIGAMDLLIAAHAKSLDLTLVTNNEKEFSRVKGLKIENWSK